MLRKVRVGRCHREVLKIAIEIYTSARAFAYRDVRGRLGLRIATPVGNQVVGILFLFFQ